MKHVHLLVVSLTVLLSGFQPVSPDGELLLREIQSLTDRGLQVRLFNGVVEAIDPISSQTWQFPTGMLSTREARHKDLPTMTIDLRTLDTNQYHWKYRLVSNLPITGVAGYAMPAGDVNRNGRTELYGIYQSTQAGGTRAYEWTGLSWDSVFSFAYPPEVGVAENIVDLDRDSLFEIESHNADTVYFFEQVDPISFPTKPFTRFRRSYVGAFGIPIIMTDLTGDAVPEIIYRGSEFDSATGATQKTYVGKYEPTLTQFRTIWGTNLPPGCIDVYCTLNSDYGDFDDDGFIDFVTSAFYGNTYVIEYAGSDSFAVVWSDSLPAAGRVAAGDVDGNGVEEFFVGGNQVEADGYAHTRLYAYERAGNNVYQPFFRFDVFPSGLFSVDNYQCVDVDHDCRKELLLSIASGNFVIKGIGPHQYELFYLKTMPQADGFSARDLDGDGAAELLMSRFHGDSLGLYTHTYVYKIDSSLVRVEERDTQGLSSFRLDHNFPNPFNSSTTVSYSLDEDALVKIHVFDIQGQVVKELLVSRQEAGPHRLVWDGTSEHGKDAVASGPYFIQLAVSGRRTIRKVILLR